ncbi:LytR family transcriptional regulator [Neobacillus massiliamazoniensis]|jgi:LCP family protein required for cell wall assembly|uniref:Polyisoprenyl-teichoic acid--peptidoglycan teichoic acid transferase TagU n=1 Tax=Neobacillus massiliamazoniensis TaxID=1499688 RepID=A0A0U1NTJ0_9BACI|nr:LytR family transcriptional regulator [Neobacillus massiliamazoniensis]CRK81354.1 membrane-bound protein transcriptional regulator LytR [Neobacillus massiliamazoniensis]
MRSGTKKGNKWLKITGIILLALVIAVGVYAFTVYKSFKNAVTTMHQPIERKSELRQQPVEIKQKQPFSVLMLGVDERPDDKGRSDTIIVLTVNPNNNSVKMLSIPRDTRTEIVGKGTVDKINHAYAFGGVPMSMDTVEKFLNIPIDYYMKINMDGFKDIVDAIGGVTVKNDLDFTQDGFHFPVGNVTLNGEKALSYTRMRYEDPNGDFGRQARQRKIIQAVIDEGTNLSSLTKFSSIFGALGNNIKTNLTFDQIVEIQKNYRDAGKNIKQMEIKETGTMIDNIYYGIVSPEEKQRIQTDLRAQMEVNK